MNNKPHTLLNGKDYACCIVNLDTINQNYRLLMQQTKGATCAPVVKADAYGLGMEAVSASLNKAGADEFFVAYPDEGVRLREILPSAVIYVLSGCLPNWKRDIIHHRLTPVLCTMEQVRQWGWPRPAAIYVDTGMHRTGLSPDEFSETLQRGCHPSLVVSHLACADEADNQYNRKQLELFKSLTAPYPALRRSLANSAGIFLGREYHFDKCRPGMAIYGLYPPTCKTTAIRLAVEVYARVIQVQHAPAGNSVGYGCSALLNRPSRLATLCIGYKDGIPWSLANKEVTVDIHGYRAPLVGRVSMDFMTVDVTDIPEHLVTGETWARLIGDNKDIAMWEEAAGTLGYEFLTRLGSRYRRLHHQSLTEGNPIESLPPLPPVKNIAH